MKKMLSAAIAIVLFCGMELLAAPTVTSNTPAKNAQNVSRSAEITLTFSESMNDATLSSSTIIVQGSQSGVYSGSGSYNSANYRYTFSALNNFKAGELITVTVTTGVKNSGGTSMANPFVWSFTIKSNPVESYTAKTGNPSVSFDVQDPLVVDLNGDQKLDIVFPSINNNSTVYKNNGDSTFTNSATLASSSQSKQFAAADINLDGKVDLINSSFKIYKNTGDFTFEDMGNFQGGGTQVAVADINGDGLFDLLSTDSFDDKLVVRLNTGNFTFGNVVEYATESGPQGIAVGDFNEDGRIDVVVANYEYDVTDNISIFYNNGDGTFGGRVNINTQDPNYAQYGYRASPYTVNVGDVNNDGHLDIVVSNFGPYKSLAILKNNGSGSFSKTNIEATLSYHMQTKDLKGDGNLEILKEGTGATAYSLSNDGSGNFSSGPNYTFGSNAFYLAAVDLTGSGSLDLIGANSSGVSILYSKAAEFNLSSVSPLQNQINLTNSTQIIITFDRAVDQSSITEDHILVSGSKTGNHEGTIEYNSNDFSVTFTPTEPFVYGEKVFVSATTGLKGTNGAELKQSFTWSFTIKSDLGGSFGDAKTTNQSDTPRGIVSADINNDGKPDLMYLKVSNNSVYVSLNDGRGNFDTPVGYSVGYEPYKVIAADVNNDHFPDLVTANNDNSNVTVLINNQDSTFQSAVSYSVASGPTDMVAFDVNGDGFVDIVTSNNLSSDITFLKNNQDGTFSSGGNFTTGRFVQNLETLDFDGDGFYDIIVGSYSSYGIVFLKNNNGKSFSVFNTLNLALGPKFLKSADLNGDGYPDFVTLNYNTNTLSIYKNTDGEGNFENVVDYNVGSYSVNIEIADYNGDQKPDIIVSGNGGNYFYKNNGNMTFTLESKFSITNATYMDSGDYDGDGSIDFAVGCYSPKTLSVFLNNSGSNVSSGSYSNVSITSPVTLNGDLTISGTLSLGAQITNDNNTINIGSKGIIFGETPSNYIVGKVQTTRIISSAQNNIAGMGISIDPQSNNLGSTFIKRETGSAAGEGGIKQVWTITPTTQPTGPVTVTLSWPSTNDNDINLSDLVVYKTEDSGETWDVISSTIDKDSDPRTATFTITSFTAFTIGVSNASLPAKIVSFSPTANSLNNLNNTSISIEFSLPMNSSTLDSSSITVIGSQSGRHLGNYIYNSAAKTVTFNSDESFQQGEIVHVIVTKNVKNSGNAQISNPFIWSFSIKNDSTSVYQKESDLSVGATPLTGYAADVDNDGDIDLISANSNSTGSVSVILNNGDNTYANAVNYPADYSPRSVIATDVNADGFVDIIASNFYSDNLSVLINKMDGTFNSAVNYQTDYNPISVTSGDIDGDGDFDLITANYDENDGYSISILKNNSDGTFSSKIDYSMDVVSNFVTVADLDSDGDIDIITSNNNSGNITVSKNNGDGTIQSKTDFSVGSNPGFIASGDLNNDKKVDLVVTNWSSNTVSVLLNVGDSTFAEKVDLQTLKNPSSVQVVDVDGDSDMDILISNAGSDSVSVLKNGGSGSFAQVVKFKVGSSPRHVFTADLDGNNRLDLVSVNSGSNTISIYRGFPYFLEIESNYPTENSYTASETDSIRVYFSKNLDPASVIASYVKVIGNRSGLVDFNMSYDNNTKSITIKPTSSLHTGENYYVSVLKGINGSVGKTILQNSFSWNFTVKADSGGVFGPVGELSLRNVNSSGFATRILTAGYLNGDQLLDFAIVNNNNQISVLINNGNNGFNDKVNYDGPSFMQNIISVDYNNDGLNDLVTGSGGKLSLFKNLGDSTFADKVDISGDWVSLYAKSADLNGDGLFDLIAVESPQSYDNVNVLMNTGSGTFTSAVTYSAGNSPSDVFVNDLNSDGLPDLASANRSGNNLSVLLNDGKGGFLNKVDYSAGAEPYGISGSDFDSDGDIDLVVANASASSISVLMNNGTGIYGTKVDYTVGVSPTIVSVGDLNGDGYPDIAVANYSSNTLSLMINNGDGTFAEKSDLNFSSPTGLEIVDVNGDGSLDILAVSDSRYVTTFMNNTNSNPSSGTYKNITFNNNMFLSGDLNVSGTLFHGDNYLSTNGHTIKLGSSGSISGETPSNYIVGKVQTTRTVSSIQNNIGGMGISIDPQSNNLGSTLIKRETGTAIGDGGIKQKWTITPTTQPAGPVTVTLSWPSSNDNGINLTDLAVYKSEDNGDSWNIISATVNKDSDPRTATFTISSFSQFTIGESANLPVEMSAFTAVILTGKINLKWSTVTESNNSGWEIERAFRKPQGDNPASANGHAEPVEAFSRIGFVAGKGTTTEKQNYQFSVNSSELSGTYQFRLKQIDTDGKFSYSEILTVDVTPTEFGLLQNYPNPFNPTTAISYQLPADSKVRLVVFDMLGREVITLVNEEKPAGRYVVSFNGSGITSGVYFYKITAGDFSQIKKMILVK